MPSSRCRVVVESGQPGRARSDISDVVRNGPWWSPTGDFAVLSRDGFNPSLPRPLHFGCRASEQVGEVRRVGRLPHVTTSPTAAHRWEDGPQGAFSPTDLTDRAGWQDAMSGKHGKEICGIVPDGLQRSTPTLTSSVTSFVVTDGQHTAQWCDSRRGQQSGDCYLSSLDHG